MGAALGALLAPTPLVAASCLPGSSFCEKPNVDPNSGTLEAADLLEAPEHFSFSRGNWGRPLKKKNRAAQALRVRRELLRTRDPDDSSDLGSPTTPASPPARPVDEPDESES